MLYYIDVSLSSKHPNTSCELSDFPNPQTPYKLGGKVGAKHVLGVLGGIFGYVDEIIWVALLNINKHVLWIL
jgi:hypothetical protein